MIAFVSGILDMKLNGYIVIDVGGVGYKVFMSEAAIDTLGELGEKVKVYTHHHVREDDISLYGFLTMEELKHKQEKNNLGINIPGAIIATCKTCCRNNTHRLKK